MTTKCSTLLLPILLFGSAAQGLGLDPTVKLNRSNVGTVSAGGDVRLKFDFLATPADQTYNLGPPPGTPVFPVAGRWQPDTTESVGYYLRNVDNFYLRTAQTTGPWTSSFDFFPGPVPGNDLYPIMGDWDGDGIDTAGIFDRDTGTIYLKNDNSTEAPIVHTLTVPQVAGGYPVAGDWDGNSIDELGVWDRAGWFRLFDNLPSTSFTTHTVPGFGGGPSWPLAGDWNFDGKDYVGVYVEPTFYLLSSSAQTVWSIINVSDAQGLPVAGSWDGESFRITAPPTAVGLRPSGFGELIHTGGDDFDLYFAAPAVTPGYSQSLFLNQFSGPHLFTNSGWQPPPSIELLAHDGATAPGSVLSASTPVFADPQGNLYEKLAVYVVEHPQPMDYAGWVCLSYSNGGNVWTDPIHATNDPNVEPTDCLEGELQFGFAVLAELVSGFRDGSDLYFGVMDGDNPALFIAAQGETPRTFTYLYTATTSKPWHFSKRAELTSNGVTTPNTDGRWVYNFGINLDFTLDPVELAVYWTRSYPYPFDIDGSIPCNDPPVDPCPDGPSQNPNRIQIYRLALDPTMSLEEQLARRLTEGPWSLFFDAGSSLGYPSLSPMCASTALNSSFQFPLLGLDIDSAGFVKDEDGLIWRDSGGRRTLLFGGTAVKDKTNGECDFGEGSLYLWREPAIYCIKWPCWP